jgi:hydrogenase maturation protein HypF
MVGPVDRDVLRRRIHISGVVQGVGFRPHVYNLAQQFGVRGFVLNSSSGVTIEGEAPATVLDAFWNSLRSSPPPLARIEDFDTFDLAPVGYLGFEIRESLHEDHAFALISPDIATCSDCRHELLDPADRRFGYPFTNCTNCGPRYTIVRDIPYDRPLTTMAPFVMCSACAAEYHDPRDRRFHAQPNACPVCGPALELLPTGPGAPHPHHLDSLAALQQLRRILHAGEIVALRGLGGFQLACDARNSDSVARLRQRKKRSDKPFAVMAKDLALLESLCTVAPDDRALLLSPQHPIVLLEQRPETTLPEQLAPGSRILGAMLPTTPLHEMLFQDPSACDLLVMTSGNLSDEPIVVSNEEALQRLAPVADWFLLHNRDIYMRVDDSVARTFQGQTRILRRSRGYAPQPIDLQRPMPELLACGAELKNALCLTKSHYAILSQHIGDVENYETLQFFQETLANLKKLFRVEPEAVAHDLHPLYLTTKFGKSLPLPALAIQHHHAHIASCMAENHLRGQVIGVAFDGTGYGTDGQIWGGEFMVADFRNFERSAHFRYIPLAGGDTAVRQPWRSALGWLRESYGASFPDGFEAFTCIPERDLALVSKMIAAGLNTVATSSCGRLFDAVAFLVLQRKEVTFEGQAAIELELCADKSILDAYPFELDPGTPASIDLRPMMRALVTDLQHGIPGPTLSARFHNTIASVIAQVCATLRRSEHLNRVCLSGGTFQNLYLLERATALLSKAGFEVFLHASVPPNDGGIALGQAVIASEMLLNRQH